MDRLHIAICTGCGAVLAAVTGDDWWQLYDHAGTPRHDSECLFADEARAPVRLVTATISGGAPDRLKRRWAQAR